MIRTLIDSAMCLADVDTRIGCMHYVLDELLSIHLLAIF